MPSPKSPFSSFSKVDLVKQQLKKLEKLSHPDLDPQSLEKFDLETQEVMRKIDGRNTFKTGYVFATMAEGEALLNLPESAQEPPSRDLFQKSIQQRRQLLLGLLREMETKGECEDNRRPAKADTVT